MRVALAKAAGVEEQAVSSQSVSSTWGASITRKAIRALIIFLVLVALFIAWRFEWRMAVAAIIAMVHDVLISVGVYSVFGFEVTPATVVAFLTILGFSLYDTIVVFDKVKDNDARYTSSRVPYADIMNVSMNQVLMRSLNTSLAAVLPVLSLLIIGAGRDGRGDAAGVLPGPARRPDHRFVLVDLRRHAGAGDAQGADAEVPVAARLARHRRRSGASGARRRADRPRASPAAPGRRRARRATNDAVDTTTIAPAGPKRCSPTRPGRASRRSAADTAEALVSRQAP